MSRLSKGRGSGASYAQNRNGMRRNRTGRRTRWKDAKDDEDKGADEEDQFPSMNVADQERHH